MLRVLLTALILSHLQLWSSSVQGKSRERENEVHINFCAGEQMFFLKIIINFLEPWKTMQLTYLVHVISVLLLKVNVNLLTPRLSI